MAHLNKNNGPFLVFDKVWFKKHQSVLLWLLNTIIVRYAFRYFLRIDEEKYIVEIAPNYYILNSNVDKKQWLLERIINILKEFIMHLSHCGGHFMY